MAKFELNTKREQLAKKATRYNKTLIMFEALLGANDQQGVHEFEIHDYSKIPKRELEAAIPSIERDLQRMAKSLFADWNGRKMPQAATWLATKFDEWMDSRNPVFELGRVHEVEAKLGVLPHRLLIDCPPYAEVLLQGLQGAAIRHPEYHLAVDLSLLYNLFLDSVDIMDRLFAKRIVHSTEYMQSIGRSVIVTCFNLLESFVSGLAAACLIQNKDIPEKTRKELEDDRAPLRTRFFKFPNLIAGNPSLIDPNRQPMKDLFGLCKDQRDSFVHCEPGPAVSGKGIVKEIHFHDVSVDSVRHTVDRTCEAISFVWNRLYGRDGPTWLPIRNDDGRFPNINLRLQSDQLDVTDSFLA